MTDFIDRVCTAMEAYFGADARRIAHARQVADYARELLDYIDADPIVITSYSIHYTKLYDVGAEVRLHCGADPIDEVGHGFSLRQRLTTQLTPSPRPCQRLRRRKKAAGMPGGRLLSSLVKPTTCSPPGCRRAPSRGEPAGRWRRWPGGRS